MPENDWKEYVRRDEMDWLEDETADPPEWLEESIQNRLDMGQKDYWNHINLLNFNLLSREKDTLAFEVVLSLKTFLEKPELTLHVENIAIYENDDPVAWNDGKRTGPGPGASILRGPFDFTFTLGEPIPSVRYTGDVKVTVDEIPLKFTSFEISVLGIDSSFEVLAPVNPIRVAPGSQEEPDEDKLSSQDVSSAVWEVLLGLWTKDGKYIDLKGRPSSQYVGTNPEDNSADGSVGRSYPYVVDPETVTAVNLAGTRVELGKLKLVTE